MLSPPAPLNGESKELSVALARHLLDEVERARIGKEDTEARGRFRSNVREVRVNEAIVTGVWCGQLVMGDVQSMN